MKHLDTRQLRLALAEYARPATGKAVAIFLLDVGIYALAIAGVIFLESMILKILCSLFAGVMISSLFVIGHDAAHNAYTGNKRLNRLIARIALLPSLHNYGLWLVQHNRLHHQSTNVQGIDSWSPWSKAEFDALPSWRRKLERFYRSVPGIGIYYLIERWWKDKFYPRKGAVGKYNSVYQDFLLLVVYLAGFLSLLIAMGQAQAHTSALELVCLGFVVPFMKWNYMMGFTIYQQHTHETMAWSRSIKERQEKGGQEDFTMYVAYPKWYNLISHNIMEHTAHHVDPRIPMYHLADAQRKLETLLGNEMNSIRFSVTGFLQTMRRCKLFDYDNLCWLDFDGNVTSRISMVDETTTEEHLKAA